MSLRTALVTATTAAVLASSGVALAGASGSSTSTAPTAQTSTPAASSAPAGDERRAPTGHARRLHLRKVLRGAADVVSKTIGIDRAALREGLRSGQTIGQIASANNVDPKIVIDAMIAAANSKLDAAVTAGKITAARAAKVKERLPARITKLVNEWHPRHVRQGVPS